ncbi:MAG: wax ester/triacylglycerol synthase family O-acyltransferase [Desulfobacterales bacterium]|nr:wax ester/triacylglycerol synthase family O-acyltransferase [Desulfobacterales bacterium]
MIETMSNVDNFWLQMDEPTNLMVITGFMELEKPMEYEHLCRLFEDRLLRFPRFKQKVVKSGPGMPSWVTDRQFDIRSHVHRVALPEPGGKKEFQTMTGDLMGMPLDITKPLWQCHLIENVGGGCALFFRIHHCIGDGIALIHVLLSMADTKDGAPLIDAKPPKPKKKNSKSVFSFDGFKGAVKKVQTLASKTGDFVKEEIQKAKANPSHVGDLVRIGGELGFDVGSLAFKLLLKPSDPKTSFKGKLGIRKCAAWGESMSLEDIKTIGKALGATVNDVLIGTMTGALRYYLQQRNNRVNELDLRVAVPVNIRRPGTEFELGNKFSLIFLSLPVYIQDPILRIREVKRRMDTLKHSPEAFVGFQILNTIGALPTSVAKNLAYYVANKATGVLTNVPGPKQPLYFGDQQIKNMMFWVPRSGQVGLGISILSYNNTVTIGFASDELLVPDPDVIITGFKEEFEFLFDFVQSGKMDNQTLVLNDRYMESMESMESMQKTEESVALSYTGMKRCMAMTKSGRQCRNLVLHGSQYCYVHKPNTIENYFME